MIVFVGFDQIEPGGGQKLVINFATGLYNLGLSSKIYCSKKSFVFNQLNERKTKFIHIDSEEVEYNMLSNYINRDDVVILMYFSIKILYGLRVSNPKIIFYSIFPEIFFSYSYFLGIPLKRNLLKLVNSLKEGNAINFMDYANYYYLSRNLNFSDKNISFIPVPITGYTKKKMIPLNKENKLKITYIGRGEEEWKIFPVVKIIEDLSAININFEFHIITTNADLFESLLQPVIKNKIDLKYIVGLSGINLTNYLEANSDLHFSMGTAALEASILGIPTILVDFSHSPFPKDYRYRWIYENNPHFNLGFLIDKNTHQLDGLLMKEILEIIYNDRELSGISEKCYDYSVKRHSLEQSVMKLIHATEFSNYTVNDLFMNSIYLRLKGKTLSIYKFFKVLKIW